MRVVVVGAGLQGVSTAHELARRGCEVTVLERDTGPALATSYANAGMLTPSMADPWNAPGIVRQLLGYLGREDAPFLLRPSALPSLLGWGLAFIRHSSPRRYREHMRANLQLASYSLSILRELRQAHGLDFDQRANGTIKVFRDRRAFDAGVARNDLLRELGLDVRALDGAGAVAVEPALAPIQSQLVGAIHCPVDESGDAHAFTKGLAQAARGLGARFRFGCAVTGFERAGDRVVAVLTDQGRIAADDFVLAAGSWSPQLVSGLRLGVPVRPVKGYSITVDTSAWRGAPRMPVIDDALHAAATPLGTRLRVAGTAEIAGYDTALTPARIDNLFALLLGLFPTYTPHLERARALPWAGLRPVCADGVPLIGASRISNLHLNTGQGHLGWTLAAGSARLLVDLMLCATPALDPAPYDAKRRV